MNRHRILFVDSNAAFNLFIENIIDLDHIPIKARYKFSSIHALAYLRSCAPSEFPTVIISEIRLPFCKGFEFINRCVEEFYGDHPETLYFLTNIAPSQEDLFKIEIHPVIKSFIPKPFTSEIFDLLIQPALVKPGALTTESCYP